MNTYWEICMTCGKTKHVPCNKDGECAECVQEENNNIELSHRVQKFGSL